MARRVMVLTKGVAVRVVDHLHCARTCPCMMEDHYPAWGCWCILGKRKPLTILVNGSIKRCKDCIAAERALGRARRLKIWK